MEIQVCQCDYRKRKFPFNLIALFIKKFQKTGYNHYSLRYYSLAQKGFVYFDASGSGVKVTNNFKFLTTYKVEGVYKIEINALVSEFENWALFHAGKKYGKLQILGIFLRNICLLDANPFQDKQKRFICTELVAEMLNRFKDAKIKNTDSLDLNQLEVILDQYAVK